MKYISISICFPHKGERECERARGVIFIYFFVLFGYASMISKCRYIYYIYCKWHIYATCYDVYIVVVYMLVHTLWVLATCGQGLNNMWC